MNKVRWFPLNELFQNEFSADEILRYEQDDSNKSYGFVFVTYGNPGTILDNLQNVVHACCIYHDQDTKPGTQSKCIPHYHLLVLFKSRRYLSAMRKICRSLSQSQGVNTFVESAHSIPIAALYLLHQDEGSLADPNKHTYVFDDLICDNPAFWQKTICGSDTIFNEELVRDILYLNPLEMAFKYGKDYIRNIRQYDKFREFVYNKFGGELDQLLDAVPYDTDTLGLKNKINNIYYQKGDH